MPRRPRERERAQKYSPTLTLASALHGGEWSINRVSSRVGGGGGVASDFLPVPIAQETRWAPGPVWTGPENLAPTGIQCPDRLVTEISRPTSRSTAQLWLNRPTSRSSAQLWLNRPTSRSSAQLWLNRPTRLQPWWSRCDRHESCFVNSVAPNWSLPPPYLSTAITFPPSAKPQYRQYCDRCGALVSSPEKQFVPGRRPLQPRRPSELGIDLAPRKSLLLTKPAVLKAHDSA